VSLEPHCWARPRPIRVAFLVQDGEHAQLALDGIFADCYGRWGGRFSLIAPCVNGQIIPSYWPWLEAFDPDIVYSYVELNRESILEIHERINPSNYAFHYLDENNPRLDIHGFKPQYRFSLLSSLSTIFRQARYNPNAANGGTPAVNLLHSWHTEAPSRFFRDNFGVFDTGNGGSVIPTDARTALSLTAVVSPDHAANRQAGVPLELNTVPDEITAFSHFANRRATSMSVASLLYASKMEFHSPRWGAAFNLVVGSSFRDRVLFWNARLHIPAWLDSDLQCLRVDEDQTENQDFLAVVSELIRHRNHNGNGGQPRVVIRSNSVSPEALAAIAERLRATNPWSAVGLQHVETLDELAPEARRLEDAREGNRFGGDLMPRLDWTRFDWMPPTIRPPAIHPDHLLDAPVRQAFAAGHWACDINIDYDGPLGISRQNRWGLPRRWRMAQAFEVKHDAMALHDLPPQQRGNRLGNLTTFPKLDSPIASIKVPSAEEAVFLALQQESRAEDNVARGRVFPRAKVAEIWPSNESRYLNGILGLAGGLERTAAILLHPFLKNLLASFGGTPNLAGAKVEPTVNRLAKWGRNLPAFDIRDKRDRLALSTLIVRAASGLKTPERFISYSAIRDSWSAYKTEYWERNPQQPEPGDDIDWNADEMRSLDDCLIDLRQRRIFFQGHHWLCDECHHRNWLDLGSLRTERTCEVCQTASQTPVSIEWQFRPNEFLIDSLRDHSALSLIWVLQVLSQRARSSFAYVGPSAMKFSHESTASDAEADLLVISDGKALLCEVKSSWASVRKADINKLVQLATRLRPDVALLAVMEENGEMNDLIADATQQLAQQQIEFELLLWRPNELLDGPYLPSG